MLVISPPVEVLNPLASAKDEARTDSGWSFDLCPDIGVNDFLQITSLASLAKTLMLPHSPL